MEQEYITRKEYEESVRRLDVVRDEAIKRLEEEDDRQNHRIDVLENTVREIRELAASVKELAADMRHMRMEQEKQGARLESIEKRDGVMWQTVVRYALTAGIGAVIWALVQAAGIF